jgi:exopolysaccharide biosynthesis polyprenyl glycosylphosphotransferase
MFKNLFLSASNASSTTTSKNGHLVSSFGFIREKKRSILQILIFLRIIGDLAALLVSLLLGFYLKFQSPINHIGIPTVEDIVLADYLSQFFIGLGLYFIMQFRSGYYRKEALLWSPFHGFRSAMIWGASIFFISMAFKVEPNISRLFILYATSSLAVMLFLWQSIFIRLISNRVLLQQAVQNKTLIIGWNNQVKDLIKNTKDFSRFSPRLIVGVLGHIAYTNLPKKVHYFTRLSDLENRLKAGEYDEVIVADQNLNSQKIQNVHKLCSREMVDFSILPSAMNSLSHCLKLEPFYGTYILSESKRPLDRFEYALLKRTIDIIGAFIGLILFTPIMLIFGLIVFLESPGPVIYFQVRTSRGGKPFNILKIRSMELNAEDKTGAQWCKKNDNRKLKIGSFMRKYNIDELPQFWNVLVGEMSLVGPRPERPELINKFKSEVNYYNSRHRIKPGITGWAQVNGWRGDTSLESRIACDLYYEERASLLFDLRIMFMTIFATKNAY